MCVVSYINHNEGFYFTSNRDIPKNRKIAIPPKCYTIKRNDIILENITNEKEKSHSPK